MTADSPVLLLYQSWTNHLFHRRFYIFRFSCCIFQLCDFRMFLYFLFDFLWVQANVSRCSFAVVPLTHCSYDLFILVDVLICEIVCVCVCVQSCLSLWDPMDCSLPGSSIHGISLGRILEWVAISFSRGSSRPRDRTHVSCVGKWILYHWATCEASHFTLVIHILMDIIHITYAIK